MSSAASDALLASAGNVPTVLPASARRPSADDALPLPVPLRGLLPEGVLRRGATLRVSSSASLLLAVLGEASRSGAWCAAVGLPTLGVAAAAAAGVDLDRFALVPAPGGTWPTVVAALLDALDVIAVAPRHTAPAATGAAGRRLSARARERRAVLLVVDDTRTGTGWEGVDADLSVVGRQWEGVGLGHGYLQARSLDVLASGRRIGGRPRTARLHVAASGAVTSDVVQP